MLNRNRQHFKVCFDNITKFYFFLKNYIVGTPNIVQLSQPIQKLPTQNMQIQAPVPIVNQQQEQTQQIVKAPQQPQTMDSGIASNPQSTSSTASSTSTMKKRRAAKSSERYPKLVVLRLLEEKIVECEMEVKPKTVTFKFDVHEVNPDEVAKDLVK